MTTRSLLPILVFAFVLPVLAGCETMGSWVDGGNREKTRDAVSSSMNNAPVYAGGASFTDAELRRLMTTAADGSVEIYNIDGGVDERSMMSIASQPSPYDVSGGNTVGAPYSGDPSVTVFSLDSAHAAPSGYAPMVPAPFADVPNAAIGGGKPNAMHGRDVSRIYFEYGSARIGGNDDKVLRDAAEAAKFAPVDRIRVEGHASVDTQTSDPVRARMLNLKESMNRAYSVSRRLIEQGVPAEKIKTVAWGDTVPTGSNKEQRRVDIITGSGY